MSLRRIVPLMAILAVTIAYFSDTLKKLPFADVVLSSDTTRRRLTATNKASFQGIPLSYHTGPPPDSTVHCIGETFGASRPWLFRSCQFRNLCWDTTRKEFVVFPSTQEQQLARLLKDRTDITISSLLMHSPRVSLGAVEDDWSQVKESLAWFPTIIQDKQHISGYYQMDDSHIIVPYLESSDQKQDLLSIFTLLFVFGLEEKQLVLLNMQNMPDTNQQQQSHLVCAPHGAAGLGLIMANMPQQTFTIGRDATLRAFGEYAKKHGWDV